MKTLANKSSICAYLLAVSLIISSSAQAIAPRTVALTTGGLGLVASFLALYKRKPEAQFKYRFIETYEKLKAKKNLSKKDIKDMGRLLYYMYYDGFVGQTSASSKVKANKEDRSLEWSESCDAYGILGNVNEYIRPLKSAFEALGVSFFVYKLSTSEKFAEALLGIVNKKADSAV